MLEPNYQAILRKLRSNFIELPHVKRCFARFDTLLHSFEVGRDPDLLLLLGATGMGKTTLLEEYARRHPRTQHATFTEVQVLRVSIPSRCTIKKLAGEMLRSLGSEFWNRGDEGERTYQLVTLLKVCKTRIILLDEVNHLVDRGKARTHHAIADWIKQLAKESAVPIVLAGTLRTRRLVEANDQLRDRTEIVELRPFTLESAADAAVFRGLLKSYVNMLAGIDPIDFSESSIARMVMFASAGRLRPIRRLLARAIELCQAQQLPVVTLAVLAEAFGEVIYKDCTPERNPFASKFNGIPLNRPGEPFAAEAT